MKDRKAVMKKQVKKINGYLNRLSTIGFRKSFKLSFKSGFPALHTGKKNGKFEFAGIK